MSDPIQVIDALCRLLAQALDIIQDEASRNAMMAEFNRIMGEEKVEKR